MSGQGTQIVFLLSLPRSGSTLLQRLLAAHPEIATNSEGWLALPLLYALRQEGVDAEYGHRAAAVAIGELSEQLPRGRLEYLEASRDLLVRLYGSAADGRRYFLDKTPRYHLIADELVELFAEAKLILLWRNPLAIAASLIDSWNGGNWNLDVHAIDLFGGLAALTETSVTVGERALSIRYEDLVNDPEREVARATDWLGLEQLSPFPGAVPSLGSLGDHQGVAQYSGVSTEPLDKWQTTLGNPVRRTWARRYLHWIGRERLALMGYELDVLLADLDAAPVRWDHVAGDVGRNAYGAWCRFLAARSVSHRRLPWPRDEHGWR